MYQLFEPQSSTYTYLLCDFSSGQAVLIDPVLETAERDLKLIQELKLKLKLVLETHIHADHVTGAGLLQEKTGCQIGVAAAANTAAEVQLFHGQRLNVGAIELEAFATPGHTKSCFSFYQEREKRVFTGDALFIRGCGRTDFQEGSASTLFQSVRFHLFNLPLETKVYPAHDYNGIPYSTIELETKFNPRLRQGISELEFVKMMSELHLSLPKKIKESVPANLNLGRRLGGHVLQPKLNQNIPEVQPQQVHQHLGADFMLVDVRRPDEFNSELGHIQGAQLVTLGPDLMKFLDGAPRDKEIVFVCRSGGRSGQATALSRDFGFQHTMNMVGGMLRWNELQLPVTRE